MRNIEIKSILGVEARYGHTPSERYISIASYVVLFAINTKIFLVILNILKQCKFP